MAVEAAEPRLPRPVPASGPRGPQGGCDLPRGAEAGGRPGGHRGQRAPAPASGTIRRGPVVPSSRREHQQRQRLSAKVTVCRAKPRGSPAPSQELETGSVHGRMRGFLQRRVVLCALREERASSTPGAPGGLLTKACVGPPGDGGTRPAASPLSTARQRGLSLVGHPAGLGAPGNPSLGAAESTGGQRGEVRVLGRGGRSRGARPGMWSSGVAAASGGN